MSLLLMLMALLGALAVLGGGGYVLDRVFRDREAGAPAAGPAHGPHGAPAADDAVEPLAAAHVEGGYSLLEPAPEERVPRIPRQTLAHVRELLALGRGVEAVRVMRDDTGMDLGRAERAVSDVRDGRIG